MAELSVAEILAMRPARDLQHVVVAGRLRVTSFFSYLAARDDDVAGVLICDQGLEAKLAHLVPPRGGSLTTFIGNAVVEGELEFNLGLPMFPAQLHSIKWLSFHEDGWQPVTIEFQ